MLEAVDPGWRHRTLADAERICEHVVRLLGSDAISLRNTGRDSFGRLPWHQDVHSGYCWDQRTFFRRIEVPYGRADIKVPWELSRCQHLPTLGMAHLASGDSRYAAEIVAQIDDWIATNPPGYGVNWACTMDVALRAVNWLWAFQMIARADAVSAEFSVRLLSSLIAHARHISRNIERYAGGLTTNHTVADHAGLLHLGLVLADLPEAGAWVATASAGLEECIRQQVHADGVDFENSVAYHRLVLEMLAVCHLLVERTGGTFSGAYRASLRRMFEFVLHYTRPDGLAPLIGDSDDGRLLILSSYFDWDPQDHRYLLGLGGALFGDVALTDTARGLPRAVEEVAWLMGADAGRRLVEPATAATAPRASCAFVQSGRYVMRRGGHHAVICADEVGTAGLGNHKHNDIFGYELSVSGVAMIVDCGSFAYTGNPAWRDRFRATRAHNTLVVDGVEQNETTGPFGMRTDARIRAIHWQSEGGFDLFDAEHTGYERLSSPVVHRRRILLAEDPFAWLVLDELRGTGTHELESSMHLAPGGALRELTIDPTDLSGQLRAVGARAGLGSLPAPRPTAFGYSRKGTAIILAPLGWDSAVQAQAWFSPRYGQRVPMPVLRCAIRAGCGVTVGCLVVAA
jgi:hypothetical protein